MGARESVFDWGTELSLALEVIVSACFVFCGRLPRRYFSSKARLTSESSDVSAIPSLPFTILYKLLLEHNHPTSLGKREIQGAPLEPRQGRSPAPLFMS